MAIFSFSRVVLFLAVSVVSGQYSAGGEGFHLKRVRYAGFVGEPALCFQVSGKRF